MSKLNFWGFLSVGIFFVVGCSSTLKEREYEFFSLDPSVTQPFPDFSKEMEIKDLKIRNTSLISSVSSLQNSRTKLVSITSWTFAGDQLSVDQELQVVEKNVIANNVATQINGSDIFKGHKIKIKVNCSSMKVTEVIGDTSLKKKILALSKGKKESDSLLEILNNLIEQSRMSCTRTQLGPFTLANASGKQPAYSWDEPVPIPGFEKERMKASFLGWQIKDGKRFAVLEGTASGTKKSPEFNNMEQSFKIEAWAFITPDRSTTRRLAKTKISVRAGAEAKGIGDLTIDVISERLN